MVFHWRLSDSKSPQVSRTLLSILAVFNNAVVWIDSTQPPTSKSSRPFNNPWVTVLNAPITISIIITCMFHSFFNSLARSRYLSLFSHSFSFILWSSGTAKSIILQIFFFFLLIIIRSGLLAEIRWSVCMSKSHYYYYYLLIRAFHISDSWWFFTGVWVTASLLKSPGLFSLFRPIGKMRNCLDAHLGQIVCDKDGVVDWFIVLVEMPLTRFEECWPLPTESLPELP